MSCCSSIAPSTHRRTRSTWPAARAPAARASLRRRRRSPARHAASVRLGRGRGLRAYPRCRARVGPSDDHGPPSAVVSREKHLARVTAPTCCLSGLFCWTTTARRSSMSGSFWSFPFTTSQSWLVTINQSLWAKTILLGDVDERHPLTRLGARLELRRAADEVQRQVQPVIVLCNTLLVSHPPRADAAASPRASTSRASITGTGAERVSRRPGAPAGSSPSSAETRA